MVNSSTHPVTCQCSSACLPGVVRPCQHQPAKPARPGRRCAFRLLLLLRDAVATCRAGSRAPVVYREHDRLDRDGAFVDSRLGASGRRGLASQGQWSRAGLGSFLPNPCPCQPAGAPGPGLAWGVHPSLTSLVPQFRTPPWVAGCTSCIPQSFEWESQCILTLPSPPSCSDQHPRSFTLSSLPSREQSGPFLFSLFF